MNSRILLTCFYFFTSHVLESQEEISINLKSNTREYDRLSCPASKGMIHGKDKFMVTIKLAISGLNTPYMAIFGLSAAENGAIPIGTSLERPYCPRFYEQYFDTCNCQLMELNEIHFICYLLATCKIEQRLYVYMLHNKTYYNTESFSVLKVYVKCEDPPGPFSGCAHRMPKRVVTYPYDTTHSSHRCKDDQVILSGVDIFKMVGRVALHGIPSTTRVFVNFGVVHKEIKNSSTFLGTTINFIDRDCPPVDHDLVDSCTCLGDEIDEFRVVCTLKASIEHSGKMAFFFLHTDGQEFLGDCVRMPRVLMECDTSSATSVLAILLYIFLSLVFMIVCILSYKYFLKPYYDKVKSNKEKTEIKVSEFLERSKPNQLDDDDFTL